MINEVVIDIADAVTEARVRTRALLMAAAGLEDPDERDALQELAILATDSIGRADLKLTGYRELVRTPDV